MHSVSRWTHSDLNIVPGTASESGIEDLMELCQVFSSHLGDIGTKQRRAKCGFGQ